MTVHRSHVVLHVSDGAEHLSRAAAAAESLASSHPHLQVRIIVNGAALDGLVATSEPVSIEGGVTIEACEVGMQRRDIDTTTLQPGIRTVPSAIAAIVDAQLAGAAYLRL